MHVEYDIVQKKVLNVPVEIASAFSPIDIGTLADSSAIDIDLLPVPQCLSHSRSTDAARLLTEVRARVFLRSDPRSFLPNMRQFRQTNSSSLFTASLNGMRVFVKQMPFRKAQRPFIVNEVTSLNELRSKFVVWLISAHLVNRLAFLVMDYLPGGSLIDIAPYRVCDEPAIAYFALKILKALDFVHGRGWLHRDIKSANVLLTAEGGVKLGDFGFAIESGKAANDQDIVGTPYYMAPEVAASAHYSAAADVWSVGIICRELAEGRVPHSMLPPMIALGQIETGELPPIAEPESRSRPFLDFVERGTERDPRKRATVAELLRHPFLATACDRAAITECLKRARQAKANDIFASP
jgi:serine/threonine protein kinase